MNKTLTVHSSRTGYYQYFRPYFHKNIIPKLFFFMPKRKHNPFVTAGNSNDNSDLWKISFIYKKRTKSFLKRELLQNSVQDFYVILIASHSRFNGSVNIQVRHNVYYPQRSHTNHDHKPIMINSSPTAYLFYWKSSLT